ncbi:sirohydrochlorin chelatase [Spiractinospora alimapuensis]|uniref:sirohydrochlorin chelatase n=1 Tax=Spiractinospora alimapuensis TaxID=2820884 RepID=UPI001F4091C4|nr:CbiX/SirB N-terminal domain-containing protein [Spiractinospora alimapuensis]
MAALARRAGRFVGAATRIGFADVGEPDVGSVAAATDTPLIVVPAFLASGFHVRIDVPRQLRAAGRDDATVTPALDHDPSVADALRLRLREAGHRPGEPVVLAAAGSSRPEARVAALRAAEVLGRRLRTPVEVGYVASATPTVAEAVRRVRAHHGGRVCVASWLLAPGSSIGDSPIAARTWSPHRCVTGANRTSDSRKPWLCGTSWPAPVSRTDPAGSDPTLRARHAGVGNTTPTADRSGRTRANVGAGVRSELTVLRTARSPRRGVGRPSRKGVACPPPSRTWVPCPDRSTVRRRRSWTTCDPTIRTRCRSRGRFPEVSIRPT